MKMSENKYYTKEYWFNNPINDDWDQGGEKYYVNDFYQQIVFRRIRETLDQVKE